MRKNFKHVIIRDLLDGESGSNGFGLYKHEVRTPSFWRRSEDPYSAAQAIDGTVVEIGQQLGYSPALLVAYMDSKLGRWTGDSISIHSTPDEIRAVVKKFMIEFQSEYGGISPAEQVSMIDYRKRG